VIRRGGTGAWLAMFLCLAGTAQADPGKDPVTSVMWGYYQHKFLNDQPYVFDDRVILNAPPFAEDARQVPIEIDARAYKGQVVRILAWAELNPLPQIVDFQPIERVLPWLAIRIRIEQATPLRAAVLTRDGLWHIGSTSIEAAGGGCTAPSVVRTQPGWEEHIGEVLAGRYPRTGFSRLRLQIAHPMDNGMVSGIPEFYLNQAQLKDDNGKLLASLELFPAVSENPVLGFDIEGQGATRLWLRDISGNQFSAAVK
jgi:sulfur-oxidizing protein SoxY